MIPVIATTSPTITDDGELIALFHWNQSGDLVRDVDLIITGNALSPGNNFIPKEAVDGPDADLAATAYVSEGIPGDMAADAGGGQTYKRVSLELQHEAHLGTGNGITGDDETTENTRLSWDTVFSAGTPTEIPAALR